MIGVSLLGATGSIGASTLAVLRQHRDTFRLVAVAARADWQGLLPIIAEFEPEVCALEDAAAAVALREAISRHHAHVRIEVGSDAVTAVAALSSAKVVVAGISGFAGLPSTWAAVAAGKQVLLANKEALVASGTLLLAEAKRAGANLLPIDSEHNAVYQCANGVHCDRSRVRAITLTASGGPFRNRAPDTFHSISPDEACKHPTWSMGRKISVDSATLMNKGLEVIEAHFLFDAAAADIDVVVHPQSIVHSMVEYRDGSVLAQLGNPDMRTAIAYALAWPQRIDAGVAALDLVRIARLGFEAVDRATFRCLDLAYQALASGGSAPATLNAANEEAVAAFLDGHLPFLAIETVIEACLERVPLGTVNDLPGLLDSDLTARREAQRIIARLAA